MSSQEEHYRNLLASHYSWMFGLSFAEKIAEQRALLEPLLEGAPCGPALDLGSGPGFQSFALAELGFSPVHAIDTSAELLAELNSHLPNDPTPPIHTHHADILTLSSVVCPHTVAAAVCMGDTLTHLPSLQALRNLFAAVAAALRPGGLIILTWRDLSAELTGTNRFIPVRSTDHTIMTCFLEYASPATVQVHDLIYRRDADGNSWTLAASSYPKLRIAPTQVVAELAAAGLAPDPPALAGRLALALARK